MTIYLLIWILPSLLVSILIGAYVGYNFALRKHGKQISKERAKTLVALQRVVESTEELSTEVGSHNAELQSVEQQVGDIATTDSHYETVKGALLQQIATAVDSNRKMEQEIVCTRYALQEQAQELDKTRLEARTDELSGLANRKAFDEDLQFMIAKLRNRQEPFALLLIDVDHFKWVNDTHGHIAGDNVVSTLGTTLKAVLRPEDHVARFGGDEFGCIMSDVSTEVALKIVYRLQRKVESTNFDVRNGARIAVTLSMGLAMSVTDDSPEDIIARADKALYKSKANGRNQLQIYDEAIDGVGNQMNATLVPEPPAEQPSAVNQTI